MQLTNLQMRILIDGLEPFTNENIDVVKLVRARELPDTATPEVCSMVREALNKSRFSGKCYRGELPYDWGKVASAGRSLQKQINDWLAANGHTEKANFSEY